MRQGQLVVRRRSPWRHWALVACVAAGAILLLYGAYEWGRFDGGYDHVEAIRAQRESADRGKALEQENATLRAQIASVEVARKIEAEAYSEVERTLGELQAKVLRQDEELTFYRGIVSPEDGLKALTIQRFEITPAGGDGRYLLRLVLVQSLRQDRTIAGDVSIELEGLREGSPVRLGLAETAELRRKDGRLAFSFRYFENMEQEILLPTGFDPTAVTVEVRAARQDPIRETFPWRVQIRG